MIEALRVAPFAFVGALVATLAFAWNLYRAPRKRLQAELVFDVRSATRYTDVPKTLKVGDEDLPTDDMRVVFIDVRNSGNEAVEASHFHRPLTLGFGDRARVIRAKVLEEEPQGIGASLVTHPSRVTLEPLLLNAGDLVRVEALVFRHDHMRVAGRVVGVKRIRETSIYERIRRRGLLMFVLALLVIVADSLLTFFPDAVPDSVNAAVLGILTAGAAIICWDTIASLKDHRRLTWINDVLATKPRFDATDVQ